MKHLSLATNQNLFLYLLDLEGRLMRQNQGSNCFLLYI